MLALTEHEGWTGRGEENGRTALISRSLNYLLEFVALVLPLYFLACYYMLHWTFKCPSAGLYSHIRHHVSCCSLLLTVWQRQMSTYNLKRKLVLHKSWSHQQFILFYFTCWWNYHPLITKVKSELLLRYSIMLATARRWRKYFSTVLMKVMHHKKPGVSFLFFYQFPTQIAYQFDWLIAFGFLTVFFSY